MATNPSRPRTRSQRDEPVGRAQHLDPERMYISTEVHQGVTVTSAGSRPKPYLHPNTVRVLHETFGIAVSGQRPEHLDALAGHAFDYAITPCDKAREICREFLHHTRRVHWSIPDPAAADGTDDDSYPAFERAAADSDIRIRHLLPLLAATADERTSRDRT